MEKELSLLKSSQRYICRVLLLALYVVLLVCFYPNTAYAYQTYVERGLTYKVTENGLYATRENQYLYYSGQGDPQFRIGHWGWQHIPSQDITINQMTYRAFRPTFMASNRTEPVGLPNDCIKTAQIVAAVVLGKTSGQNQSFVNGNIAGFPEPSNLIQGNVDDKPDQFGDIQEGEAYIGTSDVIQDAAAGNFHAATVVHVSTHDDTRDNITLEASPQVPSRSRCRTSDFTVSQENLIFDMYNERQKRNRESFSATVTYPKYFKVSLPVGKGFLDDVESGLIKSQKTQLCKIMGIERHVFQAVSGEMLETEVNCSFYGDGVPYPPKPKPPVSPVLPHDELYSSPAVKELSATSNINWTSNTISWDPVDKATEYEVIISIGTDVLSTHRVRTNSLIYNFPDPCVYTYTATIRAYAEGYLPSAPSSKTRRRGSGVC